MSDKAVLKFKTRESGSKGANKALINEGYLLANIVEKGKESISVAIKKDEFRRSLNTHGRNAIYTLQDDEGSSYTAMVRDVQLTPLVSDFYHVDFQVVSLTEEITVDVLINIIGQDSVAARGYIVNRNYDTIPVTGFPQDIPDTIDIDVTGFEVDSTITMADIKLDKVKAELADDELIISISEPKTETEDEDGEEDADATDSE
ncbi:MAG: 50S ribosomal protein L25 [Clostridiales bacterium]|nr:50S ribosomal protein L25 [Clostridiales bacterium]